MQKNKSAANIRSYFWLGLSPAKLHLPKLSHELCEIE